MIPRLPNAAWLIAGVPVVLALAGASYQAAGNHLDAKRSPELGLLVNAGGLHLRLNCTGQGSPTVILESGLGDLGNEWRRVQPEIAKRSRVCSYDRAGYGGSEAGTMPRTSRQIATELHTLLRNAGEMPPFVLVGHSFGGFNVRVYNSQYPNQVAGLVLVDSVQEDQYELLPAAWEKISSELLKRYQNQATWAPIFIDMGVARLMLQARKLQGSPGGLDESTYLLLQSKYLKARASELDSIKVSAQQAREAGDASDKPLIVLTAGKNSDGILRDGLSKRDLDEFQRIWVHDLQMRLARLSSRGERIIVSDSGHDIPLERPGAIVSAIEKVRTAAGYQ